jgi:hypothetical protein
MKARLAVFLCSALLMSVAGITLAQNTNTAPETETNTNTTDKGKSKKDKNKDKNKDKSNSNPDNSTVNTSNGNSSPGSMSSVRRQRATAGIGGSLTIADSLSAMLVASVTERSTRTAR